MTILGANKSISSNGNIIAEDPDLPYGTVEYNPKDVMGSMISSVITNTGSSRKRRAGKRRNIMPYKVRHGGSRTYIYNESGIVDVIDDSGNSTAASAGISEVTSLGPQAVLNVARSQIGVEEAKANQVKYNDAYYGYKVKNSSQDGYA